MRTKIVTRWARSITGISVRRIAPWHAMVGLPGGLVRQPTLCDRKLLVSTLETAGLADYDPPRDGRVCPKCRELMQERKSEYALFKARMRARRQGSAPPTP